MPEGTSVHASPEAAPAIIPGRCNVCVLQLVPGALQALVSLSSLSLSLPSWVTVP